MPDLYTPIDGKPWPQERFARQAPTWSPSGVIGAPQAAYGSGPAALSFAVAGSVITVALSVFRATARGFLYERTDAPWQTGQAATAQSDATASYALNTNANARRDRLVLRRDLAAGRVYPYVLQGAPAVSPAAPALVQVETGIWDTPLFSWTLAGGSSTSVTNIVDERNWIDPAGPARGHLCRPMAVANPSGGATKYAGPTGAWYAIQATPALYIPAGRLVRISAIWQWGNGDAVAATQWRFERTGTSGLQTAARTEFIGGTTADSVTPSDLTFTDIITIEGTYAWTLAATCDLAGSKVGVPAGSFSQMTVEDVGQVPLL